MKPSVLLPLLAAHFVSALASAAEAVDPRAQWGQWRGPEHTGYAPLGDPPTEWGESKNVKWKVKIPGSGHASPIVWGDKVFVLTAIAPDKKAAEVAPPPAGPGGGQGQGGRRGGGGRGSEPPPTDPVEFKVLCLDRVSGKTLWQQTATNTIPHEGHHEHHGFASASPVTDGERLYAFFGSRGLHCYDLAGKPVWSRQFGRMRTRNNFGEGASPAVHGDTLVVNWDHEDDDFITALDKRTGRELWRKPRSEITTWTTPLVVAHGSKPQVIVAATERTRSYDLATGEQVWECGGMTGNVVPTPLKLDDMVYVLSGWRGAALQAIKLGRAGDLTGTDAIVWSHAKATPYVPSPALIGGNLYFLSGNTGVLSCFDAKTGKALFDSERLPGIGNVYASITGAKDRVYIVGRDGKAVVLKNNGKPEVLASNSLDEGIDASPAIVGRELFLRGREHLYCLAEK